jgi:transposase
MRPPLWNIVEAYNNQEGSYRQLAQRFRVSFSFVKRLLKRYKDTGKIEPKPYAGGHNNRINGVGGVQELEFNSMP